MKTNIFQIQIVPVEKVLPHEYHDQSRSEPLMKKIRKDGVYTNPIIVTPFGNGSYLQLDGMNRLYAFKSMKMPFIPAQLIDYNDQESVELSSWLHLFPSSIEKVLSYIRNCDCLLSRGSFKQIGHRYINEEGTGEICTIVDKSFNVYSVSSDGVLPEKIAKLKKIVDFYKGNITRDVLPSTPGQTSLELLFEEHSKSSCMAIFPTFTRHQIIQIVQNGDLFPSGVTRHIIKRRCLNLNIPLSFFTSGRSIEKLNEELDIMLSQKQFRVYEEPTLYFE